MALKKLLDNGGGAGVQFYPHPPASFQSKLFTNIKVKELRASAMCFDE